MNSFYSMEEMNKIGFKSLGEKVLLSRKCSIYSPENISIGNNVRIDDFTILSGDITIGNYVHISAFCALYGKYKIEIGNYCGCSPRCTLFSATDDFSGEFMISPLVNKQFTNVSGGLIKFEDFVQIGANSIIMPNVILHEGAVTGAFSFVTKDLKEWSINVGIPTKMIKERKKDLKKLAMQSRGV